MGPRRKPSQQNEKPVTNEPTTSVSISSEPRIIQEPSTKWKIVSKPSKQSLLTYKSVGSLRSDLGGDGSYDPLEERHVEHPTGSLGAFMHLIKSAIGAGILSMPNAFKHGGLTFSTVGTIAMGIMCAHCCYILAKTSRRQCKIARRPYLDFGSTAEQTFLNGPPSLEKWASSAKHFVNVSLWCTYYGLASAYLVYVANQTKQLAECTSITKGTYPIPVYVLLFSPVALILSQFRTLKSLVPISIVSNFLLMLGFCIVFYIIFHTPLPDIRETKQIGNPASIPIFFSIVVFAMENVGVILPVENHMKNPRRFLGCGVLVCSMVITVTLYVIMGFLGYWKFLEDVRDSITLNAPPTQYEVITMKAAIMMSVLLSYGLAFFVPTHIIWESIKANLSTRMQENQLWIISSIFRIVFCLLTITFAVAVPKISSIMGIIGALFFSTVGILCPVILETITFWEPGCSNVVRVIKNVICVLMYIAILCSGTYAAILELTEFDASEVECT